MPNDYFIENMYALEQYHPHVAKEITLFLKQTQGERKPAYRFTVKGPGQYQGHIHRDNEYRPLFSDVAPEKHAHVFSRSIYSEEADCFLVIGFLVGYVQSVLADMRDKNQLLIFVEPSRELFFEQIFSLPLADRLSLENTHVVIADTPERAMQRIRIILWQHATQRLVFSTQTSMQHYFKKFSDDLIHLLKQELCEIQENEKRFAGAVDTIRKTYFNESGMMGSLEAFFEKMEQYARTEDATDIEYAYLLYKDLLYNKSYIESPGLKC